MRMVFLASLLLIAQATPGSAGPVQAESGDSVDLQRRNLTGEWYVLIHYKDDQSVDKTITRFKDFAWSVKQTAKGIDWQYFPYVLFSEEVEEVRRDAMTRPLPWEPDAALWQQIRQQIGVSPRATTRKHLSGNVHDGFKTGSGAVSSGRRTLTFSRNWDVRFEKSRIVIRILDALSGGAGLAGMEEATVFRIEQAVDDDEFRGHWHEGTRHGEFRMVRVRERKVLK